MSGDVEASPTSSPNTVLYSSAAASRKGKIHQRRSHNNTRNNSRIAIHSSLPAAGQVGRGSSSPHELMNNTIVFRKTYSMQLSDLEDREAIVGGGGGGGGENNHLSSSCSTLGGGGGSQHPSGARRQSFIHLERAYSSSSVSTTTTGGQVLSNRPVRDWVRLAWAAQIVASFLILVLGLYNDNWSRKYIPINPDQVADGECERAFVNVFSSSMDDDKAVICCEADHPATLTGMCPNDGLPLVHRLNRFPDAWLLPLFPLLLRIMYVWFKNLTTTGRSGFCDHTSSYGLLPALRRLAFYVFLLNFRGCFLYLVLNTIEDSVVKPPAGDVCWYRFWLRVDQQTECAGRLFDFSDHLVLFFAQILPISLVEFLHTWEFPFWNAAPTSPYRVDCDYVLSRLVPAVLCSGMFYMYLVTFLGVFRTCYYYHTGPEALVGVALSAVVYVPLCCLQCCSSWEKTRDYLFGNERTKTLE